jgi:hypothetical protein
MLDTTYLQSRASQISDRRIPQVSAGTPGSGLQGMAPMPDQTEYGTSHINIVDGLGNALAMTTTIESGFGSRLMVSVENLPGGFLLNNQLTDFSFVPKDDLGRPIANRVQAGKRPRSSMSPTLVFAEKDSHQRGELLASLGSPGGAMIIHFTAQTLWAMLHWELDAQQAINMPHSGVTGANAPLLLESGLFPSATVSNLQILGHTVKEMDMPSGLQALQRLGPDGLALQTRAARAWSLATEMAIPQSFIQELINRTDVVEVVGRYVPLKKGGANYMGLCPFHGEKSPSFSVSPTKQFFHCFGCGKNGNAIGFLMEHGGMSFIEAVKDLAQSYGLQVPEDDADPAERQRAQQQRQRQATLNEVLEKAGESYRKHLKTSPQAIDYLKGRGLSGEVAKQFGLGYAPDGWRNLASVFSDYKMHCWWSRVWSSHTKKVAKKTSATTAFATASCFPFAMSKASA